MPKELQKAKQVYRENVSFPLHDGLLKLLQIADKRLYPFVAKDLPRVEVAPGSNAMASKESLDEQIANVVKSNAQKFFGQAPQGADYVQLYNDQVDVPELYLSAISAENKAKITPGNPKRAFPLYQTAGGLSSLFDPLGDKGSGITQLTYGLRNLLNPPMQTQWDPKHKLGKLPPNFQW